MIGRMGHHSAPRATPPRSLPRTSRRFGAFALAAISLAAVGCTKTNDAVATAPAASAPDATAAPGTAGPGTTRGTTRGRAPGTTKPDAEKIPADEVDTFEATVTVDGKDQQMDGTVLCRDLGDDEVRLLFGKEDDLDFRMTFSEDLEDGTIELFDGETKTGSGNASINAEEATAPGGSGMRFGFSASFNYDSGENQGSGTMTGTGACAVSSGSGTTTTSSRPVRSTTTRAKNAPAPSRSLEVPAPNATKLAEDLVALALESYVDEKSWRPSDAWVAAGMPGEKVVGYGNIVDGTKTIVSGFEVLANKETGGSYLAFAVADVNGDCAYGKIELEGGLPPLGTHKGTEGPCSGTEAAKALDI